MWYAQDKLDEKRKKNELYRQAVERRLSSGGPTKRKSLKTDEELLRRRKESGYFGGMP